MSHDHTSSENSGSEMRDPLAEQAPTFVVQLGDIDPAIRAQAVEALSKIGVSSVPLLIDAFQVAERWLGASEVLVRIGIPAVDPLIHCLDDPTTDNFAADTLSKIGVSAVPCLVNALQHQSATVRSWSAIVLGWIEDPVAIPPLRAVLDDPSERVRKVALDALHQLESASGTSTS